MSLNKFTDTTLKPWLKLHASEIICPNGIKNSNTQTHTFSPPIQQDNTHDGKFLSYNHATKLTEWKEVATLKFKGNWDADTNNPTLTSGVGIKNDYYVVLNTLTNPSTATTLDGINSFSNGDWVVFNGVSWGKIDNQNTVQSVNSKVGAVILNHSDLPDKGTNTHAQIDNHLSDDSKHRLINDTGNSPTELFSSEKITNIQTSLQGQITTNDNDILTLQNKTQKLNNGGDVSTKINYTSVQTFSNPLEIVSKDYVDNQLTSAVDHNNLLNKGTNTHAQIDNHLSDDSKHRLINDTGNSPTELFSSEKITNIQTSLQGQITTNDNDILTLQNKTQKLNNGGDVSTKINYTSAQTFSNPLEIVSKDYVDSKTASLQGALRYCGVYNASTNSPNLISNPPYQEGCYYIVSVDGSQDLNGTGNIDLKVGDWIVRSPTKFEVIDNTDQSSSVSNLELKTQKLNTSGNIINTIIPNANNIYDFGADILKFSNIWGVNINGDNGKFTTSLSANNYKNTTNNLGFDLATDGKVSYNAPLLYADTNDNRVMTMNGDGSINKTGVVISSNQNIECKDIECQRIVGNKNSPNADLCLENQSGKGIIIKDNATGEVQLTGDNYSGLTDRVLTTDNNGNLKLTNATINSSGDLIGGNSTLSSLTLKNNLNFDITNAHDLGTSSFRARNVWYSTKLYGNVADFTGDVNTSNVLPLADNSSDIGSNANSYKDFYLKGNINNVSSITPSSNENVSYGLNANNSGATNISLGSNAGNGNSGQFNVMIGRGCKNGSGGENIVIGDNAGSNDLTGIQNICIGSGSGSNNLTSNNDCIFIGRGFNNIGTSGLNNMISIGNGITKRANEVVLGGAGSSTTNIRANADNHCDLGYYDNTANNCQFKNLYLSGDIYINGVKMLLTPAPLANPYLDGLPFSANLRIVCALSKLLTAYSGSCLRVRRSSDNQEQDINFDATGYIDKNQLSGFLAGSQGFVVRWYDQSGLTNNMENTTVSEQPELLIGTNNDAVNDVRIKYDGIDDRLKSDQGVNAITNLGLTLGSSYAIRFSSTTTNNQGLLSNNTNTDIDFSNRLISTATAINSVHRNGFVNCAPFSNLADGNPHSYIQECDATNNPSNLVGNVNLNRTDRVGQIGGALSGTVNATASNGELVLGRSWSSGTGEIWHAGCINTFIMYNVNIGLTNRNTIGANIF